MKNLFVKLEDLEKTESKMLLVKFDEEIPEVNSVGNIKSDLTIKELGDMIEISGNIKGIVKLECDICLKEFDYELDFNIDEYYAKHALLDEYSQETELKDGQFVIDLEGADEIDIYDLMYQSVILNLPNKKVCGINCNEGMFAHEENIPDPRMEVFKNIKLK
ncbi:DUF177 domain-containing protein [bacterium]|nr:DUF177 domain-containing protein [bacterium]